MLIIVYTVMRSKKGKFGSPVDPNYRMNDDEAIFSFNMTFSVKLGKNLLSIILNVP